MKFKVYLALYYERVSTVNDAQSESLENQRALAESYLSRHPEIQLAEPIDSYSERISGKSDTRPKFQAMLDRLRQGDIDYILVKDLKRLSRSTEVSAALRNMAKRYNFKIILLSTGQIYDPNAGETRMMFGFESLVNEEVVFRQSEYGRIAHKQKCEAKRLNRNNVTFGYKWDPEKKDIVIDEEKAEVIRKLFDKYVFQDEGITDLRKYLSSIGLHYSSQTVAKWMKETAYIGIFHLNKKGSELGVGAGQKTKRFFNPKEEWIPVERPDLAIVDEEIFKLAQQIRERRMHFYNEDKNGVVQARFRGQHLFSSKLICGSCGSPYVHGYADRKKEIGIYKDSFSSRNRNALEKCDNIKYRRVYESDMERIVLSAINGLLRENKQCFDLVLSALEQVIRDETDQKSMMKEKEKELKKLIHQAEKTKAAYIDAPGALRVVLAEDYERINSQISIVKDEIAELQNTVRDEAAVEKQIQNVQNAIQQYKNTELESLDRKTVDTFIHKIVICLNGIVEVHMSSDSIQRYSLLNIVPKKMDPQMGSSFYSKQEVSYNYDKLGYLEQVREFLKLIIEEHKQSFNITLFSYDIEEKRCGAQNRNEKRKFNVAVEINFNNNEGSAVCR